MIEIKRSSAPTVSQGFYIAADDVNASRKLLVAGLTLRLPCVAGLK